MSHSEHTCLTDLQARLDETDRFLGEDVTTAASLRDADRTLMRRAEGEIRMLRQAAGSGKDYHAALQRIGTTLGLQAGSDLTTACVPAIEALRAVHPSPAADRRPALPPMTEALRDLLGTPVHTMIPLVRLLQSAGLDVPRTYEGEQAGMMYWMLGFYFEHGDDWRAHARTELTRLQEAIHASQPAGEATS